MRFLRVALALAVLSASIQATQGVTLSWNASADTNVVGYFAYYGPASGNYTNKANAGKVTSATISNLLEGTTCYFVVTAYTAANLESVPSNEVSYTVPKAASNQPPTLNPIGNVTINTNAGLQTVNFSGISSGAANEVQTLTVTAASSSPGLIPNPTVSYTSPNSTGSLSFAPAANASGSATITVTVNDGGASNNIITRSFTVTVGTPPTFTAFFEAESGVVTAPMTVATGATASNGQYVYSPTNEAGTVSFQLNITQAADYVVWCRVLCADTGSDSLYVSMDNTNEDAYYAGMGAYGTNNPALYGQWVWTQVNGATKGNPRLFTLSQGAHTLSFRCRESSTLLDALYLTNDRNFVPPANPVNQTPTLNAIGNVTVNENAGLQTVNFTGISSGATNEVQTLTVTAVSSNPGLIPNPAVSYTSANSTGILSFAPVVNGNGSATITVTVNDGGANNNVVTRSFVVTVNAVNQAPTLNPIGNLAINANPGLQTVNFSGISSGAANEGQTLTVTAVSSNPALIPNPTVSYTSANSTGSLSFAPAVNGFGSATVTVTVNDGGTSNNVVTRSFTVTVNAINEPPTLNALANVTINTNAGLQTVTLSGIGSGATNEAQTLTVTATSSNPGLIPNPTVSYTSPNGTGSLSFAPTANGSGNATVTVTVNDGQTNNNTLSRSFTVTVSTPPTVTVFIEAEAGVVTAPMLVATNLNASNGRYVYSPIGEAGTGSFQLNITQAADYVVWCRVLSLGSGTDSFYVSADNGPEDVYDTMSYGYSYSSNWTWTPVNGRANGNPRLFTLSQGVHNLSFRCREPSTLLDAIYVTNDRNFVPSGDAANQPPTLNPIGNVTINEDAGLQTVTLSGIGSGATNEAQTLTVTATSSNPGLIPNPTVSYTSPNGTGSLSFAPAVNGFGSATITVTVNDGGTSNNVVTRSFTVTVNAVNEPPTVALTSPLNGVSYTAPATINLAASVTANGHTITKVQFYNGANLLGEDTSAPYSFTWGNVSNGNYRLTAGVVYDSGSIVASSSVGIAVASVTTVATLWPSTAVPGLVDAGADSAVELGVKFRSDVAGSITGIRFYKASANTGTHVANLWTSTGTRLATATFTGESASGWQQVLFAVPVAITANTIYVASYHANNGHFSVNWNYFSVNGVDNSPLHAPANGVSGGNGVYAYGANSAFPNQTWSAANYWVDVVFQGGPPPALTSIAVTPANPAILAGATQQFTATGTYSDGSTQNLTSQATWASSSTTVATVNASGLATTVSAGATTLSAALTGVTGSSTLTVTANPPTTALTSPANGASYTAPATINLAASVTANGHTITKVQFYNGATLLGEDTSAPYSFIWSNVSFGSYSLTARAVYDAGSTVASSLANINVLGLPAPWQTADIGNVGVVGSASVSNGLYTVKGAGNINDTADNFRFVYQTLSRGGEIRARLNWLGNSGANASAGVMIRETLTRGSEHAFMGIRSDGSFLWKYRSSTANGTPYATSGMVPPPDIWVRLVRAGDTFYGYKSTNGVDWTLVNSRSITMATTIYIGVAVCSGATNTLNTATFTNLTVVP